MTDTDKLLEAFAARHAALVKATGLLFAAMVERLHSRGLLSAADVDQMCDGLMEAFEAHLTSSAEKADRQTWSADELEAETLHHLLKHLRPS